ncbi:MAG: glycosyltransferase family 4 protein [Rhodospirillales bacterium]|nr:glycosyltransferase family 4 protein [Rhodospirillales bacterium]
MTRPPVRVLLNALHAKTGGGVTYLKSMLPRLAQRQDMTCHLLIHKSQHGLLADLPDGIKLDVVDFKDGFIRRLIWEQLVLPLHAWACADVTFSPANFGPLLAPRPVVLLRNALDVEKQEGRLTKRLYWKALRLMTWLSLLRAPVAGAVSNYARRSLGFRFQKKIKVLHHGVDAHLFHASPEGRQGFILAVGDLTVQKNYGVLLQALAELPDIPLKIAGQPVDEAYAGELASLIGRLGLKDRVTLLGRVEPRELALLYRRCRLFVFPSTVETFGNPLVEAMASRCAILCSNAAAMPEILGDAGRYCESENSADWAGNLSALWNDDEMRRDLGERALARAKLFSWEATAQATGDMLVKAADTNPSRLLGWIAWSWLALVLSAYLLQFRPLLPGVLKAVGWH